MPSNWTFTLLGTPSNGAPRSITLSGWQAPFGRPRKGAIVDLGTSIRVQKTYFAGDNVPPVVHSVGNKRPDFELHGRWMDFGVGAKGGAQALAAIFRAFVEARLPVRAQWGSVLSYQIFIEELKLPIESEAQYEWHMNAIVLKDETQPSPSLVAIQRSNPGTFAAAMKAELATTLAPTFSPTLSDVLAILPEISDAIDTAITNINAPFGTIVDVCTSLSDFETALTSDVSKLGSGLSAGRTAILGFRDTTDQMIAAMNVANVFAVSNNQAGALFTAGDIAQALADKAASDAAITNLLGLIAAMLDELDLTSRGRSVRSYTAQLGDSWESIAITTLGSAQGARAIRDLNGIRFGARPIPGKSYSIPSRA